MNTKLLMTLSALFMGLLGLLFTFAPEELLQYGNVPPNGMLMLLVQVCGALYVAFAIINWVSRDGMIGGIYQRPLVMGNLLHFLMVSLVLIRSVVRYELETLFLVPTAFYVIFAIWFGLVMFRNPSTSHT